MESLSEENIYKKFDLPERKAKIESIFKMKENAPVYCSCKSTDVSRFMICCEKCEEWFHGDCIDIKEKDSKYIKKWYCENCINKYNLEIIYISNTAKKSLKKKKKEKEETPFKKQDCFPSTNAQAVLCSDCNQYKELRKKPKKKPHTCKRKMAYDTPNTNHESRLGSDYLNSRHKQSKRLNHFGNQKKCIGPHCTTLARQNSKYCSEECGLAVAKSRILTVFPNQDDQQAGISLTTDKLEEEKLETIRLQKKFTIEELKKIDYREVKLLELISRCKKVPVLKEDKSEIFCFTCRQKIPGPVAETHNQVCFGQVCGCPVKGLQDVSVDIPSSVEQLCQSNKKDCNLHYNWELLARSEIDLCRLQEWNKYNKLDEEEARIQKQLKDRSEARKLLC